MDELTETIAAVVVSFNTRKFTVRCVQALLDSDVPLREILVVDNGSLDGSADAVEALSARVRVFRAGRNLGFGAANNLAMRNSSADYFVLVNSDAFVESGTLRCLKNYLLQCPEVGVVGPKLLNEDGSLQESRFCFPTPLRAWWENLGGLWLGSKPVGSSPLRSGRVEWLSGACLMIRRAVLEGVGGFDESFFLYSEETDWQRRISDAGWEVHWVGGARAVHVGGGSGEGASAGTREYFYEGVDRYFRKYHGMVGVFLLRAAMVVGILLRLMASQCGFWNGVHQVRLANWRWLLERQLTRRIPQLSGMNSDPARIAPERIGGAIKAN